MEKSRTRKTTSSRDFGDKRLVSLSGAEGFFDATLPCPLDENEDFISIDMEGGIPLKCWRVDKSKSYCNGQFLAVNPINLNKKNNFYPFYCEKCNGSLYLDFKELNRLVTWFLREAK